MTISDAAVESAVDDISDLLDKRIGLRPEATLRGRLRRSLRDEVTARGGDLAGYIASLARSSDLMQSLVNRVTVQESGFFRHPDHFEVLAEHVLPAFDEPVTIWSAGCANGQEAYSLAMLMSEQRVQGSVIATDLSTTALTRTKAGLYTTREITGISAARREKYVTKEGPDWRMSPAVRALVTATRHNLASDLPSYVGKCQVVFCRNVLIYFSPEHATAFLDKLADALPPGAILFVGSAETLWQVSDRFKAMRIGDSFVYHLHEGSRSSPGREAPPLRKATVALKAAPLREATEARKPAPLRKATAPRKPTPAREATPSGPARASTQGAVFTNATDVFQPVLLASAGQQALSLGDSSAAVVAFRKWVYLTPDDPLASFYLGLALEAGGHLQSAQRSFGVALGVLREGGPTLGAEIALEGYAPEELLRLLETKLGRTA